MKLTAYSWSGLLLGTIFFMCSNDGMMRLLRDIFCGREYGENDRTIEFCALCMLSLTGTWP